MSEPTQPPREFAFWTGDALFVLAPDKVGYLKFSLAPGWANYVLSLPADATELRPVPKSVAGCKCKNPRWFVDFSGCPIHEEQDGESW